jgi:hypothetical protein
MLHAFTLLARARHSFWRAWQRRAVCLFSNSFLELESPSIRLYLDAHLSRMHVSAASVALYNVTQTKRR